MRSKLPKSIIEEFNLEKLEYNTSEGVITDYKFKDFIQESGHLIWPYRDGTFGLAKDIYFNNNDTYYWWGYIGSIELSDENQIREHLSNLRYSIGKNIKKFKKKLVQKKLSKMENDFV